MTTKNLVFDFIKKKNLLKIWTILHGKNEKVLLLSDPESVYGCLKLLEQNSPDIEFILIENPDDKTHLVLLNNKKPVVFVGYNETGDYEAIVPIPVSKSTGINQQMFSYRYILFLGVHNDERSNGSKDFTEKPEDQKNLSEILRKIIGETPKTDELF